jgi:putative transcriptional regulator
MKVSKKTLAVRDAGRDIGAELIQAMREFKAGNIGKKYDVEINDVVKARLGTGLSQSEFAAALRISPEPCSSGSRAAERPRARPRPCCESWRFIPACCAISPDAIPVAIRRTPR